MKPRSKDIKNTGASICFVIAAFFLTNILCPITSVKGQNVVINEFVASNATIIADEDGDFEDYIELYNNSDSTVHLSGFYLSDDRSNPYLWELPDVTISPYDFLLVWASGKDRRNSQKPLHTNFRISRDGEPLLLTSPEGLRVDEVAPIPLAVDMAYGRSPDGYGSWKYLEIPTPGYSNAPHYSEPMLMHFFLFDTDLPNNVPLLGVEPKYDMTKGAYLSFISCLEEYPFYESHPMWRKASMERRNAPIAMNYRPQGNSFVGFNEAEVRGLQVKQPFENDARENSMVMKLPTTGFKDIKISFAVLDENAADSLIFDYSVHNSPSPKWITGNFSDNSIALSDNYKLVELCFSDIQTVCNNPYFKFRIRFRGHDMTLDNGDRVTFNNIAVEGTPLKAHYIKATHNSNGIVNPSGFNRVFDGDDFRINIFPTRNFKIGAVVLDSLDVSQEVFYEQQNVGVFSFNNVRKNHNIHVLFAIDEGMLDTLEGQLLIYPNPSYDGTFKIMSKNNIQTVEVLNNSGVLLKTIKVNSKNTVLRLNNFLAGTYILRFTKDDNKMINRKVVIVN